MNNLIDFLAFLFERTFKGALIILLTALFGVAVITALAAWKILLPAIFIGGVLMWAALSEPANSQHVDRTL